MILIQSSSPFLADTFLSREGHLPRGGGGLPPYETDGDVRWKIRIKPLKETNLGVAQALFEP